MVGREKKEMMKRSEEFLCVCELHAERDLQVVGGHHQGLAAAGLEREEGGLLLVVLVRQEYDGAVAPVYRRGAYLQIL